MKITITIAIALLFIHCASFAQTNPVPATVDSTEAITHLRDDLADSFNKGDLDRLLSHLDTNVIVAWQNGEVSLGRQGVRDYYNKMMRGDHPIVKEASAKPEVLGRKMYGDCVVCWGRMNDDFRLTDGTDLPLNSLFTATIAHRGDQWMVTAFHASVNAFDNPVLRVALKKVGRTSVWVGTAGGVVLGLILAKLFRRKKNDSV